jgi:predicted nucleic acid-binding protein
MKRYVFDASFILAAYLDDRSDVREKIADIFKEVEHKRSEVYITSFFLFEIANVLRYTIQDTDKGEKIFNTIANIPWKMHTLNRGDYLSVIRMAQKQNTSVYDAAYHYVAIYIDGTFLTCDKKYKKKAEKMNIELV